MRINSAMFQEGPQREIYEWRKALGFKTEYNKTRSLDELETLIRSKTKSTYPIGWQEQPLYHCEMIQRFMRVALMHYNLSKDKHKITSSFKEIKDLSSYIKKKFPNISNIHAYKATLGKRSVIFLGIIDSNNSVYCTAIYLGKNISKLRPVRDIHELLQILTIKEREDSIEVLS